MSAESARSWLLPVAAVLLVAACSEGPTTPAAPPLPNMATDAYCALYPDYCTPSTPDPVETGPGYYGGGAITDRHCAGLDGGINDIDQDLLADDCELWLAIKFRPKMIYDRADDVRRESYWAAKPVKTGFVRVFYALGYYFDLGTVPLAQCKLSTVGELIAECSGHHGDSEHIILDLRYNTTTKHWYLAGGKLSRHEDYITLTAGSAGYTTMVSYPDKVGGYPQIFVARQKHANYPSRQSCNDGGGAPWPLIELFPFDDCSPNDQVFFPDVIASRNLGRYTHRLLDRVASTYSFYQDPPRYEYMWSSGYFYGWQLDHTTHAKGYGELLLAQGF
jgi:hypothetical protein